MKGDQFRIGIISGKLGDVDGVSLETDKWIQVLGSLGHEVFTIAGKYNAPLRGVEKERQIVCEEIQFGSPEQIYYEKLVFPHLHRHAPHIGEEQKRDITDSLEMEGNQVANMLLEIVQSHDIDAIIGQNTNAMPMTLLGGIGVYKLAVERRVATIFHHHDFWWERSRFSNNHIEGLLSRIMPPADPGIEHVVLSSYAAHILRSIKRVQPVVIPNCEDFENPVLPDDYNCQFRKELGFDEEDILIVQPTRIVRRKRIEDSIELVGKLLKNHSELREKTKFVISLYQGDEHDENYVEEIKELARIREVDLHLISERVASVRGTDTEGRMLFTNRDVLANADVVTYLPIWEGFGNAFLEAIAARVPVAISTYLVYKTDLKILGFENIEIIDRYNDNGSLLIPDTAVEQMYSVLTNPGVREEMVEHNYQIGRTIFGMKTLETLLRGVLDDYGDEIRASRKRIKKSKALYSV
ncbi:MAG: glycosyltransferase family 4 protein [Spirochaetales bacterium]|nr:glycosyltransferase family 4 protein [Spirochaetales bacterium]